MLVRMVLKWLTILFRPHHVDKDHVLIRTLQRVYEEQTGEKAELLAIGGGTYARSLKAVWHLARYS